MDVGKKSNMSIFSNHIKCKKGIFGMIHHLRVVKGAFVA
jgi:hypothetical protein